jgi:NAD(P)-dependent dehydrogenase (short-subunit alcohol dehydrogenase family)
VIDLGLGGRRALVTGAGIGIGRATACALAAAGCDVALVDRDRDALAGALTETRQAGGQPVALEADLRSPGSAADAVERTVAALGGLDVAVNNVGSLAGLTPAPLVDQDDTYVHEVVAQNLLVTASCARAEARTMVGAGHGGVILNVSSGESTRPALHLGAYGAAKAAINHLTQTLAVELGPHGVRVNAVAPGTTLTPTVRAALSDDYVAALVESIPLRRLNEADDLARLVVALASDLGRSVTGQLVLADNGAHLARNRPPLEVGP